MKTGKQLALQAYQDFVCFKFKDELHSRDALQSVWLLSSLVLLRAPGKPIVLEYITFISQCH